MADNDGADRFSPREEAFIFQYVRTGNATKSYIAAGYKAKNDNTAGVRAHAILRNSKIQKAIEAERARLKAQKRIDLEWFTSRLIKEIDFDPGAVLEAGSGQLSIKQQIGRKKALKYFDGMSFSSSQGEGGDSVSISFKNKDTLARMKFLAELVGLIGNDKPGADKDNPNDVDQRLLEAVRTHSESGSKETKES
jgi:hypothetical protein